ncbi:hypothetical protein PV396_27015 [Streptomyces sp. ME02-8801-2C]|uniref:hypothetical protein n=1 Tax=Streptomyces sp. ME02-8801-2C TaxID=3028680 RepID=UPI0029A9DFEE|nr:hypothetical protein [Streptomyces sp. ME02-8801-2C]MDX3455543.1 hypothetical protein [Streptomyces sp. ME02-8801-2C]
MTKIIGRSATWVSLLLTPRGTHPSTHPLILLAPTAPPLARPTLPARRSPYSLDADTPIDGTATRSVRPYLAAHEQRLRQRESAMAARGLDMSGPYWARGLEAA